jgi:hypothetical protein
MVRLGRVARPEKLNTAGIENGAGSDFNCVSLTARQETTVGRIGSVAAVAEASGL